MYGTTIVTGNYEYQELKSIYCRPLCTPFQDRSCEMKEQIKFNKYNGIPQTDEEVMHADKQACFYDNFVPNCPV